MNRYSVVLTILNFAWTPILILLCALLGEVDVGLTVACMVSEAGWQSLEKVEVYHDIVYWSDPFPFVIHEHPMARPGQTWAWSPGFGRFGNAT